MSEKSNPTPGEPLESQANGSQSTPAEAHKVGPGRPPADTRWKKGGPSPNPRGRPRKVHSEYSRPRQGFGAGHQQEGAGIAGQSESFADARRNRRSSNFSTKPQVVIVMHMGLLLDIAKKAGIDVLGNNRQQIEQAITARDQVILDAVRRTPNWPGPGGPC